MSTAEWRLSSLAKAITTNGKTAEYSGIYLCFRVIIDLKTRGMCILKPFHNKSTKNNT